MWENNYAEYILKQLFTSVSVNNCYNILFYDCISFLWDAFLFMLFYLFYLFYLFIYVILFILFILFMLSINHKK